MDSKKVNFVQDSRLIFGKKFSNQRGEKTQRGRKEKEKKEENTEKSFVIGGFLLNTAQGTQAAPMTAVELSA